MVMKSLGVSAEGNNVLLYRLISSEEVSEAKPVTTEEETGSDAHIIIASRVGLDGSEVSMVSLPQTILQRKHTQNQRAC